MNYIAREKEERKHANGQTNTKYQNVSNVWRKGKGAGQVIESNKYVISSTSEGLNGKTSLGR